MREEQEVQYTTFNGRRIVDMDKLAQELWCIKCNIPLSLRFLVKEKIVGVASRLLIKCKGCQQIMEVNTSKKTGRFDHNNLKLAIGKNFS